MRVAVLIFPHQLYWPHPLVKGGERGVWRCVFLVEEWLFFHEYRFHKFKLVFHLATLDAFELRLRRWWREGIERISCLDDRCDIRRLIPWLKDRGFDRVEVVEPDDDWLRRRLVEGCREVSLGIGFRRSPGFLNSDEDNRVLMDGIRRPFQTNFYIAQRKRYGLLLEVDGKPIGGKWTYDVENRRRLPRGYSVPGVVMSGDCDGIEKCMGFVERYFSDRPGGVGDFPYAVTHEGARRCLVDFVRNRLRDFGAYEDAIDPGCDFLFHSVLSVYLNVGLLTPGEVIQEVVEGGGAVPLNSLEGFIRQVVGWREFMRAVYHQYGGRMRRGNFWGFKAKMPAAFYEGTTGVVPVDDVVRKVNRLAYAHHIERLMVLGNFMLLCEIDPDEVYRWFMELFIDGYDWVMVPNVYGMSQFADGGLITTKPYISSSHYILKMSWYDGESFWKDVWDALFWRFVNRQREFLGSNPRLRMLLRSYDKMPRVKREGMEEKARRYLARLHGGG